MKKFLVYPLFFLLTGGGVCGPAIAENFKISELDLKPDTVDEFDRR
ncbi:MAG: hypothetical protein V4505_13890 [Pseudomonadota bacterium]